MRATMRVMRRTVQRYGARTRMVGQGSSPWVARCGLVQAKARSISTRSSPVLHDALSVHKDAPHNKASTPFDFTEENMRKAEAIIAKYPDTPQCRKAATIPLLDLAQRQHHGWLPLSAMNKVAKILGMQPMEVYEVATFYTMFNREPVGQHFVQLCTTSPCLAGGCGAYAIRDALEQHLGIHCGETTADGKFTLIEVECLGACSNAPMMQINDDYYEDLEPKTAVAVLQALAEGKRPPVGPQNGRLNACGIQGKTTLLEPPYGPGDFVRDDL